MKEITIPKKLDPIVKAFFAESPSAAKKLIIQAAKAIYGAEEEKDAFDYSMKRQHVITNEDLEEICAFMQGIRPSDMLEAIIAAQIVVTHMLGMRKLATGHFTDQHLGLKMLRFSADAMQQLQRKRSGAMQNITVNYNYSGKAHAPIPIIPVERYSADSADS
jgi:hypothetical protein